MPHKQTTQKNNLNLTLPKALKVFCFGAKPSAYRGIKPTCNTTLWNE
jgi:hypothetical protein